MHENNNICILTRNAINDKIKDLDEKIKILISSIDNKYGIELKTHKKLIEETTHNMYDVLKEQQKDIDRLLKKIDTIESEYVNGFSLKEKIDRIYKDISHIEESIKNIHIMDKDIDISKTDIDNITEYVEKLKNDISDLENKINKINNIIKNDMKMVPAISKMYDKIMRYKYIVIGAIITLFIIAHGVLDPKSILSLLKMIGL